jgi:capsular exopolysaccharide synthesis family protein
MSKFFDETVRARQRVAPVEVAIPQGIQSILDPGTDGPAPSNDLGSSRLKDCRKNNLPLSPFMLRQFKGSDSLEAVEESYRALRTRLVRLKATLGLRSVVITSAAPFEGKTLTALNLALCCAQLQELRVLLVDGDLRRCGLTRAFGNPPAPGLADILEGKADPGKAILSTDVPHLYILGAGSRNAAPPELFAGHRWQEFVAWCNESFNLLVVDTPPVLNLSDTELITAACDSVLVVVRALATRRALLEKAARQIDPKKLLGVVYNNAENGHHNRYGYDYPSKDK